MKMTRLATVQEELAFVEHAAEHFAANPAHTSYGEIEPEGLLGLRWGLGEDCVLVVRLAESHVHAPTNYQNAIERRYVEPDTRVEDVLRELCDQIRASRQEEAYGDAYAKARATLDQLSEEAARDIPF